MLWGDIQQERIKAKMNRSKYRDIYVENLLESTPDLRLEGTGSPSRPEGCNQPKQHRRNFATNLYILEWPSPSLDSNLTKHFWKKPGNIGIIGHPTAKCAKLVAF